MSDFNKKNYAAPSLVKYGNVVTLTGWDPDDCWKNGKGKDKTLFGPSDIWLLNQWGINIISDCPTS